MQTVQGTQLIVAVVAAASAVLLLPLLLQLLLLLLLLLSPNLSNKNFVYKYKLAIKSATPSHTLNQNLPQQQLKLAIKQQQQQQQQLNNCPSLARNPCQLAVCMTPANTHHILSHTSTHTLLYQ